MIREDDFPSVCLQTWIWVLHLVRSILPPFFEGTLDEPLVDLILQPLEGDLKGYGIGIKVSERGWAIIYSLSSISHFSVRGVSGPAPSIQLGCKIVQMVLRYTKLDANPQVDQTRSARSLTLRDKYVRLIISRCFNLHTQWGWSLHQAKGLIEDLGVIFRSRNYAKLGSETVDLPKFMRENNSKGIGEWEGSDAAFTILLKLLAQFRDSALKEIGDRATTIVSRLLSAVVPVASLTFSRDTPPQDLELSRLFNRFGAAYVSIVLQPTSSVSKVQQCRRYTQFETAPTLVRTACIRAMMHLMILHKQLNLPLDELFSWSSSISGILVTELSASGDERSDKASFTYGILLRSLNMVMEAVYSNAAVERSFPDIRFLHAGKRYLGML